MLRFNPNVNRVLSLISFRTVIMLCNAILNLILLRIIIERLGSKDVGVYFVLISVGQIVSSFDLGLSYRASIIFGSKTNEFSMRKFLRRVVIRVTLVQLYISTLLLATLPFLNLILFRNFSYQHFSLFLVVFITSCFLSVFSVFNQVLIVRTDLHRLLAIDFWRNICTIVFSLLFISYSKSVFSLILAWSLANIVPNLILIYRYIPSHSFFDAEEISQLPEFPFLTSEGLHNQFTVVGGIFNNSSDQVVISALLGPSFVTSFQVLTRALVFLKAIFGIVWLQLWPLLTFGNQDIQKIKESRILIWITMSLGLIFSISYSLGGNWFVRTFLSQSTELPLATYVAVGVFGLVLGAEIIVSAGSMGFSFQRIKQWLVFASGIVNLLLSIFLVGEFGVSGCIISSIIIMSILYILPLGYIRRDFWKTIFN